MRRAVRVTLCAMYSPGRPFGISSFTRARRRRAFINNRLVVCGMCAGLCVYVCLYQYVCVREPPLEHAQTHTHARIYHRRPSRARVDPHLTLSLSLSGCVCTLRRLRRCLSIGTVYICTLFVVMPRVRRPPVSDARARTYSPVAQWPMCHIASPSRRVPRA